MQKNTDKKTILLVEDDITFIKVISERLKDENVNIVTANYGNTIVFMEKVTAQENPRTYLDFGIDKYFVKSNSSLDSIVKEVKNTLNYNLLTSSTEQ